MAEVHRPCLAGGGHDHLFQRNDGLAQREVHVLGHAERNVDVLFPLGLKPDSRHAHPVGPPYPHAGERGPPIGASAADVAGAGRYVKRGHPRTGDRRVVGIEHSDVHGPGRDSLGQERGTREEPHQHHE